MAYWTVTVVVLAAERVTVKTAFCGEVCPSVTVILLILRPGFVEGWVMYKPLFCIDRTLLPTMVKL